MGKIRIIVGEDEFRVAEAARPTIGDGVGLEVIDAREATNEESRLRSIADADASFSTPPFLEPRKVTWWRNVGFLPGSAKKGEGASEAVREALDRFAKKLAKSPLPDNQEFLLTAPKLLATSVFAKTLKAAAEFVTFPSLKPWERSKAAVGDVLERSRALGLEFAPGAAEAFAARVGADLRSISNELEKMRDYLGGAARAVTLADIAEITSPGVGIESELWSVTDALGVRDAAKVYAAAKQFFGDSGFAILMTTVVERFFRQLAELKGAEAEGRLKEVSNAMTPWQLQKNRGFLRFWSLGELNAARSRFLDLRSRAVVSSGDALDELVLIALMRTCRRS